MKKLFFALLTITTFVSCVKKTDDLLPQYQNPITKVEISNGSPSEINTFGAAVPVFTYEVTLSEDGWQVTTENSPKVVIDRNISLMYLVVSTANTTSQRPSKSNYTAGTEYALPVNSLLRKGKNVITLYAVVQSSYADINVRVLAGGLLTSTGSDKTWPLIKTELSKTIFVKDKRFYVLKDGAGTFTVNKVDTAATKVWGQFKLQNGSTALARVVNIEVTLNQDGTVPLNNTNTLPMLSEIKQLELVTPDSTYKATSISDQNMFTFTVLVPASSFKTFYVKGKNLCNASGQFVVGIKVDAEFVVQPGVPIGNTDVVLLQTVTVQ